MKRAPVLILLFLLLCGCSARPASPAEADTAPARSAPAEPARLSEADSAWKQAAGGALRFYPLEGGSCCGLYPMQDALITLIREEEGCALVKYAGEDLTELARWELGSGFSSGDFGLRVFLEGISYYDRAAASVVVLDEQLREKGRVAVPEDAVGTPLLTRKGEALYYCTASALRCLETETGIRRVVRELAASELTVRDLLLDDTVVRCSFSDEALGLRSLFFDADTGKHLYEGSGDLAVWSGEGMYYACFPNGAAPSLVFGVPGEEPRALLLPEPGTDCVFAPLANAAVTMAKSADAHAMTLSYYDLPSGTRRGSLTLPTEGYPWYITASREGVVWFALYDSESGGDGICRWEPGTSGEEGGFVGRYCRAVDPDREGLARCAEYARQIGERYGIGVRIWEEAVSEPPREYRLEPEYRPELIWRQLELLDGWLGRYPEGFFPALCEELTICLVRSITGSPEAGSLGSADGIQFWQENSARVVLAIGAGCERALYHELCHIMDTRVLSKSSAYDQWDKLNPGDFEYDYDYETNRLRQDYQFLQEHCRSFVDMYSMSFPKEDRARILENAMTEGNEELFRCPILQEKLKTMCVGIREAFGLKKYSQALAWESYLWNPLYPQTDGG